MCDFILAVIVRVHRVEVIHREPVPAFMLFTIYQCEHREVLKHIKPHDTKLKATAVPRLNREVRPIVLAFLRDYGPEWHARPAVPAVSRLCKTDLKT